MNSVWYQLFWKECREHFWKMVSLTAVLVAVPVWTMFDEPSGTYFAVTFALMFYTPLAAVFLAMGIASGERSTGTVAFIGSLPVKLWKLATAKLAVAYGALLVPVVILLLLVWLWQLAWPLIGLTESDFMGRDVVPFSNLTDSDGWYVAILASAALSGGSLLICAAAFGCNFADEIRAGAVALGGIAVWCLVTVLTMFISRNDVFPLMLVPPGSAVAYPEMILAYTGLSTARVHASQLTPVVIPLSLVVHSLLIASFLRRFGKSLPAARPLTKQRLSTAPAMLFPAPRRSKLSAIVWKQFRETGPLALIALIAVVAISLLLNLQHPSGGYHPFFSRLADSVKFVAMIVGAFVVTATGIGLFTFDLSPRLHTFWRSLPVHPDLWFWIKLVTGLALVLLAVYVPVALAVWADQYRFLSHDYELILAFHLLAFALAVLAICLLRQPIYAAILSIGCAASITGLVFEKLRQLDPLNAEAWMVAINLSLTALAITIAWAAVRWNIGVGRSRAR